MRIISGRDENGEFIGAADAWTEEKIEELLVKYNPNGKLWQSNKSVPEVAQAESKPSPKPEKN